MQTLQFPEPGSDALKHSHLLADKIAQEIQKHDGRITFEQYMAMALTLPGLGYYVSGNQKFGASGDFVTAPEISSLFSACLARQCIEIISKLAEKESACILEFGAGTGLMAADVLLEMERSGSLPHRYYILEVSADLKQRQQQTIQKKAAHLVDRVQWLDQFPEEAIHGVVLANEVLDAMPVHRFYKSGDETGEYYVGWDKSQFVWQRGECSNQTLKEKIAQLKDNLPNEYSSEINLAALAWINSLSDTLRSGVALIIDYGFSQREFYHAHRNQGTLMCHYRHRSHSDPFLYPGLQDITAHVDFTAVAEQAHAAGFSINGFVNQAFFLLGNGVEEYLQNMDSADPNYMRLSQQLKTLTMPGEMGELFKVIALGKGVEHSLQGFSLKDDRAKL